MKILLIAFMALASILPPAYSVEKGEFLGGKLVEDLPTWLKTSFMDFSDDLDEAQEENKHLLIYFHQNGCPYCAKLVEDNFHNPELVQKLKNGFDTIETNMWGDRDLTDWNGDEFTEKEFAANMKIQFTPTLLFLNPEGKTIIRLNGYQSSKKMIKVIDYIGTRSYEKQSFPSYLTTLSNQNKGQLGKNDIFEPSPHILSRNPILPANKYLAVLFESPNCQDCNDMHANHLKSPENIKALKQMHVVQLNAFSDEKLITPAGKKTTAKDWYEDLKLTYTPAMVLFDKEGQEIIRKDAFFKSYHFNSILEYVLSEKYKSQPSFQRFIEHRADDDREKGVTVNIWK